MNEPSLTAIQLNDKINQTAADMVAMYFKKIYSDFSVENYKNTKLWFNKFKDFLEEQFKNDTLIEKNIINQGLTNLILNSIAISDIQAVKLYFVMGFDPLIIHNGQSAAHIKNLTKLARRTRDKIKFSCSDIEYHKEIRKINQIITLLDLYKYKFNRLSNTQEYNFFGSSIQKLRAQQKAKNIHPSIFLFICIFLSIVDKLGYREFSKTEKLAAVNHLLHSYLFDKETIERQYVPALRQGRLGIKISHLFQAHDNATYESRKKFQYPSVVKLSASVKKPCR